LGLELFEVVVAITEPLESFNTTEAPLIFVVVPDFVIVPLIVPGFTRVKFLVIVLSGVNSKVALVCERYKVKLTVSV
jgi:hypothetical protein